MPRDGIPEEKPLWQVKDNIAMKKELQQRAEQVRKEKQEQSPEDPGPKPPTR